MLFDAQSITGNPLLIIFFSNLSMMVQMHSESSCLPNMTGGADTHLGTGQRYMCEGFYYTAGDEYCINKDNQLQKHLQIQKVAVTGLLSRISMDK